jgi:hypothetical protein
MKAGTPQGGLISTTTATPVSRCLDLDKNITASPKQAVRCEMGNAEPPSDWSAPSFLPLRVVHGRFHRLRACEKD